MYRLVAIFPHTTPGAGFNQHAVGNFTGSGPAEQLWVREAVATSNAPDRLALGRQVC